jgi:hypothetical protein
MLQFLGCLVLWGLMAALQLIWTLPLWGLQGPPLFLFITGMIVLWQMPRLSLYFVLVLVSMSVDFMMGEGIYTALAMLVAAQIPLWQGWKRSRLSIWRFIPVMVLATFLFQLTLMMCFIVQYEGVLALFWEGLLPALFWNVLGALLLYFPLIGGMNLLYYQESDYLQDAFKGNLG